MSGLRFDLHATRASTALDYFRNRALQFLHDDLDYTWSALVTPLTRGGVEWGAETILRDAGGAEFVSIYVYSSQRGHGHLRRHAAARPPGQRYITSPGCGIFDVLAHIGGEPVLAAGFTATPEYRAIEAFYGDARARRSGVLFMNHIDEGLFVLRRLDASDAARRAWCLHPIVQGDADLARAVRGGALASFTNEVVVLVMEYRNIANRFLSPMEAHPGYAEPGAIDRSPLVEVDQMLVADKVQNYKDFRQHHRASHPRAARLELYFQRWLAALGVDPSEVDLLAARAALPAGTISPPREV